METSGIKTQESIKSSISLEVQKALSNPISRSRLEELNKELLTLNSKKNEKDREKEEAIENEILESSAIAKNLAEFTELMMQIGKICGMSHDEIVDVLAHENAHSSVSIDTGHEWKCYLATFIKDENGRLTGIFPGVLSRAQKNWDRIETILKRIEVTKAPDLYENSLSPSDEIDLKEDLEELGKIDRSSPGSIEKERRRLGL